MSGVPKSFFNIHPLVQEIVSCTALASDLSFPTYEVCELGSVALSGPQDPNLYRGDNSVYLLRLL